MEKYKEITREELKTWIDKKEKFILVDVLPQGSYEGRHLPGAKHADVNKSDFLETVESLAPDKNTKVVVYCTSFNCQLSPRAAGELVKAGYTDVYHFKGGLADWQDASYAFEGGVTEKAADPKCACCS